MAIAIQNPTKEECLKALRECPPQKVELIEDLSAENGLSVATYRVNNPGKHEVEISGVRCFKLTQNFPLDEFIEIIESGRLLLKSLRIGSSWKLHPNESPELEQEVLIWNPKDEEVQIACYCFYFENPPSRPVFELWSNGKQFYVFADEVYWMPLPSKPCSMVRIQR